MKKFEGILICSDLDGTLLRADKSVSDENLEAIRYFQREGGRFTFITGRVPEAARGIYETVRPNAAIGCFNGGGVYDYETDTFLHFTALAEEYLTLVSLVDTEMPDMGIQVNVARRVYFNKDNEAMRRFRAVTGLPNITCHYTEVKEPVAKVIFLHMEDSELSRLEALLTTHPLAEKFDFIRSEKTIFEILPKGVSKGTLLLRLADIYGIDPKKTIAVGDYDNDVSMLSAAGLGIAVENASEKAKRAADTVTVSNEAHAIAKIISDLDAGRIRLDEKTEGL
jgi:Cof subfamily protein (haloacid dehalogenase superfamily)